MANLLIRVGEIGTLLSRNVICRFYSTRIKKRPKPVGKKIKAVTESLAARGFLRSHKPYDPPSNVNEKLRNIFVKAGASSDPDMPIEDPAVRFNILNDCYKELGHGVPNSMLNSIENTADITKFYSIPVNITTPLDSLKTADLPPNLNIQYEYHRFHPETDTMFNGISAYPKSSTLVTGLKYRKKYPGYTAKSSWP